MNLVPTVLGQTSFSSLTYGLFCTLHFFEFAIWGAWYVVLANFLDARGFSRKQIGRIYGAIPVGSIISPIFVGAIADKYFSTQNVIGVLHLVGAVFLFAMARTTTPRMFYGLALLYALTFAPTLALVNSIVFANVPDAEQYFPMIRVFGTVGWIAAGLSHTLILPRNEPVSERPILLASGLSLALGIFAFFLPDTPPGGGGLFKFEDVIGLIREMPAFLAVSLVIAMAMACYFAFAPLYVEKSGRVAPRNVGPLLTIGQWIEIPFMLSLPFFLKNLGMDVVLALGVGAWALRFALFSSSGAIPIIVLGIALHGICFDFFFAAGFIHVDAQASDAIRNSAQTLYAMLVYGVGMLAGTEIAGWWNERCTLRQPGSEHDEPRTNWRKFWLAPCVVVSLSLVLLLVSQQVRPQAAAPETQQQIK